MQIKVIESFIDKLDVDIVDEEGQCRANVYIEIYEGVPKVVITPSIIERDSDEATDIIYLVKPIGV